MKALFIVFFIGFSLQLPAQNILSNEDEIYTLAVGDMSFSVDAGNGGRIVSFKRAGREMLLQKEVHPVYYGSTLWLSPQQSFWPPSGILDRNPYRVQAGENKLRLSSENDTVTGFRIIKEFSVSLADTSVLIRYIIQNRSGETRQVAAWDVSRVHGGVTSFPADEIMETSLSNVEIKDGTLLYVFPEKPSPEGQKLFATTKDGCIAHLNNGLLFIKRFPNTPKEDLPPKQGCVEIFKAPGSLYVELENHSRYATLLPNDSLEYRQQWFLHVRGL